MDHILGKIKNSTARSYSGQCYFLVIVLVVRRHTVYLTFSCHLIIFKIFIISRNFINKCSVRQKFDDSVCSGLYNLMVTGSKKDNSREFDQTII